MRTDNALTRDPPRAAVTWGALFERAAAYDVSDDDVRAAVDAVRTATSDGDGDDETESKDDD